MATVPETTDLYESIRKIIPWIVANYGTSPDLCVQSKKALDGLITEVDKLPVQRLYLMFNLIETLSELNEEQAGIFFQTLMPAPLNPSLAEFLSQLVSLAICLEHRQTLASTAMYIERDSIPLPTNIEKLSSDLARVAPRFTAVLLDKGYFNCDKLTKIFTPSLLTSWLQAINVQEDSLKFNGQSLIRYSLLNAGGQDQSELHHTILQSIGHRRLDHLTNQFMIDLTHELSKRQPNEDTQLLIERFSQIAVVALRHNVWVKFSGQAKTTLLNSFPDNALIRTLARQATSARAK